MNRFNDDFLSRLRERPFLHAALLDLDESWRSHLTTERRWALAAIAGALVIGLGAGWEARASRPEATITTGELSVYVPTCHLPFEGGYLREEEMVVAYPDWYECAKRPTWEHLTSTHRVGAKTVDLAAWVADPEHTHWECAPQLPAWRVR